MPTFSVTYTCAKIYQNQFMYVRVIARQSSDVFWGDTVYNTASAASSSSSSHQYPCASIFVINWL